VFQKSVLRRIFRSKRDGETEDLRKLHHEELRNSYSPSDARSMSWAGMKNEWRGGCKHICGMIRRMETKRKCKDVGGWTIIRWILER
jgi:hypothetical protein